MISLVRFKKTVENGDAVKVETMDGCSYLGFFVRLTKKQLIINPYSFDERGIYEIEIDLEEIQNLKRLRI